MNLKLRRSEILSPLKGLQEIYHCCYLEIFRTYGTASAFDQRSRTLDQGRPHSDLWPRGSDFSYSAHCSLPTAHCLPSCTPNWIASHQPAAPSIHGAAHL